jgi:hypothetical protein
MRVAEGGTFVGSAPRRVRLIRPAATNPRDRAHKMPVALRGTKRAGLPFGTCPRAAAAAIGATEHGEETRRMGSKRKIVLASEISERTLANLRQYMASFFGGRHSVERSDGRVTVCTERERDAEILAGQFPRVVARVENIH